MSLFKKTSKQAVNFAVVNGMRFNVLPQKPKGWDFWSHFNDGSWEPQTFSFYKNYVRPDKDVIDIGGWIGPTMLIAYSLNPRKIYVVEADPANYQALKHNYSNNLLQDKVELQNLCISNHSGEIVGFGYIDKRKQDTSTTSMAGDRVKVITTDIVDYLQTRDLENTSIIKIDIEGAESLLANGLKYISQCRADISILLSLHPPFWSESKRIVADRLLPEIKNFHLFTETGQPLSLVELEQMLLDESASGWVDKTGKFFTVILRTQE